MSSIPNQLIAGLATDILLSKTNLMRFGVENLAQNWRKQPGGVMAHLVVEPRSFFFGTPVVLMSTLNEDGSPNLAPMSSAWWLNWSCMLGLSTRAKTAQNLLRERECVLNLPSSDLGAAVECLDRTTGLNPVPDYKQARGYRYEPDKFGIAHLTPVASELVKPPRVAECPVQLEAVIETIHPFRKTDDYTVAIEARVVRAHVEEALLVPGKPQYIDPDKWSPLIFSFGEFYGLGARR
jgi:flavin reductase (DIM6/NTAB) family NADH-FMN oxidoreductase RutF